MTTQFPGGLDNYDAVPVNQRTDIKHRARHQNTEDAIEALEAKVGINGSADTSSLDYKVAQAAAFPPALAASGGSSLVGFLQSGVGAIARTVQNKLREQVSITDFGANDDGVFDNSLAFTNARASLATGGVLRFPRMTSTGTYFIGGSPDFSNIIVDADDGVILSGTWSLSPNLRVRRNLSNSNTAQNYPYEFSVEFKKPWSQKSMWLNDSDKDNTSYFALNTTTDLTHVSNTYLSSDSFPGVAPALINPDGIFWASADTTQLFASLCAVRAGDEVSAAFATGGLYTRVAVIRTTAGYQLVTAPGGGAAPSLRAKLTGAAATGNTFDYDGRSTQESYYPENGLWSIRIYDREKFAVLFNGQEVTGAQVANGDITQVGFGWVPSATVTAVSITGFARARVLEPKGKRPITVLFHGDSLTADINSGWPYFFREAIDGSNGVRINNIINMAVGGETSAQQLASLTANGVQGAQFTFICVATNDIQGGIAPSTTISNIGAMIDYCAANGSTPIIWIPPLWYPNTLTGGTGQNTANYQSGAHLRSLMARLAGTKGVKCVDMTQVLGSMLATYRTQAATFGFDPMLRDNIHPTSYCYRLIGYAMARALLGQYAPRIFREKSSTFLPAGLVQNGWTVVIQPPRYSLDAYGNVRLNGVIDAGTTADGTVMYQLPVFLRPVANARFVCQTNTGNCRVTVNTDGTMVCNGAAGVVWIALDSVSFLTTSS